MCDLKRISLFWYELLPYVDVSRFGNGIVNQTGVIYDFFRESLAECCRNSKALNYTFTDYRQPNQRDVLTSLRKRPNGIGMPISLDTEFPHMPTEFVPIFQTDGTYKLQQTPLTSAILKFSRFLLLCVCRLVLGESARTAGGERSARQHKRQWSAFAACRRHVDWLRCADSLASGKLSVVFFGEQFCGTTLRNATVAKF